MSKRTNKSVQRKARADAHEYAAAYMAVGEGAGNRRKHIEGAVDYQMANVPGYREAFIKEHDSQDMAKHAEKARKENERRQRAEAAQRNTKAVISGDYKSADIKVLAVIGLGYVAHKTGADKKALEFGKRKYAELKRKHKARRAKAEGPDDDGVYRVTNL
jgi:hypothetical protein